MPQSLDLHAIPLELIVTLLIGLGLCFFGYRLKKVAFAIIWFIIGYYAVKLYFPNIVEDPFWQTILQIAAGALLSLIGLSIEKLAVSATAFIVVTSFVLQHFGPANDWTLPAIAIALGVVAGAVAVWLMKPAIIVYTAFCGANLLATSIVNFMPAETISQVPYITYILLGAIAAGGMIYQFKNTKHIE